MYRHSLLSLAIFSLFCCKQKAEEQPNGPVKQIAGIYQGHYECVSYNGMFYGTDSLPGTLEIEEIAPDTVRLVNPGGCIFYDYPFVYDSAASVGQSYAVWPTSASALYTRLIYYPDNDSILLTVPEHSSAGWLGRSFYGRKN